MAPSPLVCIMNVRLRGTPGLERACCDAAKAMGVSLKPGMQPTSPVRMRMRVPPLPSGRGQPRELTLSHTQADFIFSCGSISMACITDLEAHTDAATLAARCRQAHFKHVYLISTRPGRATWLAGPPSDQLGGDSSCVSISLPGATPRQAIQMMVTAMRALVAAVQAPSSSGDTRLAAELDPQGLSASVVDALSLLLTTTASERHVSTSAQAPPAVTEAARNTAVGLLAEAGGSLGDVCSVHPQDIVDAVGLDEAGAQRFMQAVHVPGPAAVTLTW